jgi:hypothetical protein
MQRRAGQKIAVPIAQMARSSGPGYRGTGRCEERVPKVGLSPEGVKPMPLLFILSGR